MARNLCRKPNCGRHHIHKSLVFSAKSRILQFAILPKKWANGELYAEELEFACIYHQSMFIASQFFLTTVLQSHDLAGIYKPFNPKDVITITEQRVALLHEHRQ